MVIARNLFIKIETENSYLSCESKYSAYIENSPLYKHILHIPFSFLSLIYLSL
jgi:hypothetical protein